VHGGIVRLIIAKNGGEVLKRDYIEDILGRLGVSSAEKYYMPSRKYILRTLRGYSASEHLMKYPEIQCQAYFM